MSNIHRTIEARTIRALNQNEIDTLNVALKRLVETSPLRSLGTTTAQAMLDQKMPENFFWASR